jgi:hypothetical protein
VSEFVGNDPMMKHLVEGTLPAVLSEDDQLIAGRGKTSGDKLEAMLRKVRALLTQAEDPGATPQEAQIFRNKAEALMLRYRIDEAMLADAPDTGLMPQWNTIIVCEKSQYRSFYEGIAKKVVEHVGARGEIKRTWDDRGHYIVELHYVGFPSDIRLVDMLYTTAQVAFNTKLEPKYNPELSDQENAYNMRHAGMEGWRIAMAIWGTRGNSVCCDKRSHWRQCEPCGQGHHDQCAIPEVNDANLYKARRLFKKEALERGEDPSSLLGQGNSMQVYRDSYANGFYWELLRRLREMQDSRGSESVGIELGGRREKIDQAFYREYPQYAPAKAAIGYVAPEGEADIDEEEADKELRCPWDGCGEVVEAGDDPCPHCGLPIDWAAKLDRNHGRGTYQDPREGCEKCQRAKSGYCRDHSYLRPSTAQYRERAHSPAGERAGRAAARSVDLGRGPRGRLGS